MAITDEKILKILNGRDISALLGLINHPPVSEDEQPRVVLSALFQLEALSYEDLPDLAVRVSVEAPEKIAHDSRHFFLSDWLKREGYHSRPRVIENIIARLRTANGSQLIGAILTAWVIGYRDDQLQTELVRIAGLQGEPHKDDEAQGYALAVLSDMAYPHSEQIAQALKTRLNRIGRLTKPDCWTARYAASPEMISALCDAAVSDPFGSVAVSALIRLASRYPDKTLDVWKAIESLSDDIRFMYMRSVAEQFDLTEVAHHILSEAITAFQHCEERNVLPPMNLLLEANLPSHIAVFQESDRSLNSEQRNYLKGPAIEPTAHRGHFPTTETLRKESAWKVILRLSLHEAREWLPQAMSQEDHFTLVELGEIAGFLQVTEAVKRLAEVVADESVHLGVRLGCLSSLGLFGTPEALNAILNSQVRIQEGKERWAPMKLVDALASACMAAKSCKVIWNVLLDVQADKQLREVCSYTIQDLSTLIGAPLPSAEEIIHLLKTKGPELPGYEQLLLTLSRYANDKPVLEYLREVARSEDNSSELTQVLALTGLLNEFPSRIEKLGFKRVNKKWVATEKIGDTAALALLSLYRLDPSFEPAMEMVLSEGSFYSTVQILANLKKSDHLSANILEALWAYTLHRNGPNSSDRNSLEAIALTWPDKLLEEATIARVSQWGSSARRVYLAALRTILIEGGDGGIIAKTACQFLIDGESDVRRDAARLARDGNPAMLHGAVNELAARAEALDQAIFMLDAAFWLEADWEAHLERGLAHLEPLVRNRARELRQEYRQTQLARNYLPIVLGSHDYLETWCYGQALLELGNEETVEGLYAGLPTEVCRRSYLIWLAKEIEKHIEKRRKDQSGKVELPPLMSSEQSVEVVIELEGQRLGPFAGVLQQNSARRARRLLSGWSIRIDNETDLSFRLTAIDIDTPIHIETVDGLRGEVLPVHTEVSTGLKRAKARVLLLGQGSLK